LSLSRARRLGQNFLVDRRAVARIVAALAPEREDAVLEIGPGTGALTGRLLEIVERLVAVEVDPRLAAELRQRFDERRLHLVQDDILRVDLQSLREELAPNAGWLVAGNLPYSRSKPIAMMLIRQRACVERAVLMFQREVAQRLTATRGTRAYGPLSVLAGEAYSIQSLFDVPPSAFRPRPKVVSSVTLWEPRRPARLSDDQERQLRSCLALCFARRRQMLRKNLRAALGSAVAVERLLADVEIDGSTRSESLAPEAFRRLAGALAAARLI